MSEHTHCRQKRVAARLIGILRCDTVSAIFFDYQQQQQQNISVGPVRNGTLKSSALVQRNHIYIHGSNMNAA